MVVVTIVMDSGNIPENQYILQKRLLEVESIHFQKLSNIAKKSLQ